MASFFVTLHAPGDSSRRSRSDVLCLRPDPRRSSEVYRTPPRQRAAGLLETRNLLVSYKPLAKAGLQHCVAAIERSGSVLLRACIVHNRSLRRASLRPRAYKLRAHRPATTARRRCGSRTLVPPRPFRCSRGRTHHRSSTPHHSRVRLTTIARAPADDTPIAR